MWNLIAPALLTLGGTALSINANDRAADRAGAAALQGSQITANAIRDASAQAQRTLDTVRAEGAPARSYLRTVMAAPATLTPEQQVQLEDQRRAVNNTMRGNSFAGSGRTGAALLRKVETDFVNEALSRNRQRADNAASTMYGAGNQATNQIAGIQANTGAAAGKAEGDAVQRAGIYDAQSTVASGNLMGRALGDIGSQIKNEQRESRYADKLAGIEKRLGLRT